jgi:hypothetical protein
MTCELCGAMESEQHAGDCPMGILEDLIVHGASFFNPWPQCATKNECRHNRACVYACSTVEGAVLPDGRCAFDHWKAGRDVS